MDAIVVPTVRKPASLETAATLAEQLGCALVTLHSGRFTSARETAIWIGTDVNLIAVDVLNASALPLLDFRTSRLLAGTRFARGTDTSAKRNLALLLAHIVGWKQIVFLDDDIIVNDHQELQRAAGLLGDYNAVGLKNVGYPDNSVVCHAFRLIGGDQQSFIGGGALAVETGRNMSFFPDVYNEDWFYLLDPKEGIQPLAAAGEVEQRPYDPFRNEDRARNEEFGDVMAEGIFWLLDQGRPLDAADSDYWREFLAQRKRFIDYILGHLDKVAIGPSQRERVRSALLASRGRLACIRPSFCKAYLKAWIADQANWQRHVEAFPTGLPPSDALRLLSARGRGSLSVVRETARLAATR